MAVGKQNRMNRILSPVTGKGLIVAIDHGMALGPMTGITGCCQHYQEPCCYR